MHKVGIIGYGGMGHYHAECLNKTDSIELKGIYDIASDRIELAKKENIHTYNSEQEFLSDKEIDIVLVAVPNNFHKDICISAMKANKNVICEKPVAMSSKELIEMMDIAKENNVIFTVNQNRRWDRDYLVVKKALNDNLIGRVNIIESRVQGSRGIPEGWRCYSIAGGGMMLDWGVHLIDQIMDMIDSKVTNVYCQMIKEKFPEVDEYFKLILTFENGIYAHIEVGTNNFILLPRWYIMGTDGTLEIKDWDSLAHVVRAKNTQITWEEEIIYTKAGPTKTMAPRSKQSLEDIELEDPKDYGSLLMVYYNLIDVLDNNAQLIVKPEQALRVLKVIEASFESYQSNQSIQTDI